MIDVRESCLNNWRNSGHRGRIEHHSIVLESEGIDIYLDKDVNSPTIIVYIVDNSEKYSRFKDSYIKRLCGQRFNYYNPNKFEYFKSLRKPEVITLLELVSSCKNDFFKFRSKYIEKIPLFEQTMSKPKNIKLEFCGKLFPKKVYLEITRDEYINIMQQDPPQDFRDFVICGQILSDDKINVEVYISDLDKLTHVKSCDEIFDSLQDLVIMCSEYAKKFTLNLD